MVVGVFGLYIWFLDHICLVLDHLFCFWIISTSLWIIYWFWIISTFLWIIYFVFGSYPPSFGPFILFLDHIHLSLDHLLVLDHIHLPLDYLCNFRIISASLRIIYFVFGSYPPAFGLFM